jgi:large subunit ribosomal protein L22
MRWTFFATSLSAVRGCWRKSVRVSHLVVTDARVDQGPTFKRIQPRARGMAFMILRRMSHIHVTLQDMNEI